MNKIVTYNQAVALKSLGFDEPCMMFYTDNIKLPCSRINPFPKPKNWNNTEISDTKFSAPELHDAAAWLRRNGWHVQPMLNGVRSMYFVRVYELIGNGEVIEGERQFDEYDDAVSHGIDLAITRLNRDKQ